jgi:hypothetical protein
MPAGGTVVVRLKSVRSLWYEPSVVISLLVSRWRDGTVRALWASVRLNRVQCPSLSSSRLYTHVPYILEDEENTKTRCGASLWATTCPGASSCWRLPRRFFGPVLRVLSLKPRKYTNVGGARTQTETHGRPLLTSYQTRMLYARVRLTSLL